MGILGFNILMKLTVAITFVSELKLSTQLFKNSESELLYMYETLIVVFSSIFIFSTVILMMITPVILFYLSITSFIDFKGYFQNIEKKIYNNKENLEVLLKAPKWRCDKFIKNYSLFIGNVFGLVIWNVLSLFYTTLKLLLFCSTTTSQSRLYRSKIWTENPAVYDTSPANAIF